MIEIQDITKTFHTTPAVSHVTLEIPEGAVFGLLGTNGAGKSTMLRMLAAILKPDSGMILIDGEPNWDHAHVKRKCFYLSDKQYVFQHASPETMGRFYSSLYPGFCYERYLDLVGEFDFDKTQKLRTFSKGMKKQAAILAAVCADTPYLLCDEVFDGLDPVIRQSVTALLKSEMSRRSLTPIIASHNLNELEGFCDHIGILHKGGVLLSRDIHSMQYKTHKLQCILDDSCIPQIRECPDVVSLRQEGFITTLLIRGEREAIATWIEQFCTAGCAIGYTQGASHNPYPSGGCAYTFLPLSLEEIFINETEAIGYDSKLLFS